MQVEAEPHQPALAALDQRTLVAGVARHQRISGYRVGQRRQHHARARLGDTAKARLAARDKRRDRLALLLDAEREELGARTGLSAFAEQQPARQRARGDRARTDAGLIHAMQSSDTVAAPQRGSADRREPGQQPEQHAHGLRGRSSGVVKAREQFVRQRLLGDAERRAQRRDEAARAIGMGRQIRGVSLEQRNAE